MRRLVWPAFVTATLLCLVPLLRVAHLGAAEKSFKVSVQAGEVERRNSPTSVSIPASADYPKLTHVLISDADGNKFRGQITKPSLLAPTSTEAELHFILPLLAAGKTAELTVHLEVDPTDPTSPPMFRWVDTSRAKAENDVYAEDSRELQLAGQPVLRYMFSKLDESSAEARSATFKPYHHVYDPAGKRLMTKGPGGLFPHHRGIFFGFNRISYGDGKKADTWHCNNKESEQHVETLLEEAGPVLGRHRVKINWLGQDRQIFAVETREFTAYNTSGGTMLEFASLLETIDGPIKLDGDPQHAGVQWRSSQDVPDKTAKQTYYLRPDGRGEPGKFRNWPDVKTHANLPWHALSIVLDDQRYTVCYLDRPENPKESRFSERDYGRFGSYFEYELTKEKPLKLNYRFWIQPGEMEVAEVKRLDDGFTQPPKSKVE